MVIACYIACHFTHLKMKLKDVHLFKSQLFLPQYHVHKVIISWMFILCVLEAIVGVCFPKFTVNVISCMICQTLCLDIHTCITLYFLLARLYKISCTSIYPQKQAKRWLIQYIIAQILIDISWTRYTWYCKLSVHSIASSCTWQVVQSVYMDK